MKKKLICNGIALVMVGVLLTGCVDQTPTELETSEDVEISSTEEITTTTEEATTTTEEVTLTYFEEYGLSVEKQGTFTLQTSDTLRDYRGSDSVVTIEGTTEISSMIEDGVKTITTVISVYPYVYDNGDWGCGFNVGYADKYTGTSIVCWSVDGLSTTIHTEDGDYDISISRSVTGGSSGDVPIVSTITLTCPADYDGASFWISGSDAEVDNLLVDSSDVFGMVDDIEHGDYQILFFEE